jgi:8-oxo-dGTP pyrophosphatase MutT (NUDIX family)
MLERTNTNYMDGYLSFPAGHIEHKEDVKTALLREAKEEVNIDLDPEDIEAKVILHSYNDPKDYEQIHFFFSTNSWKGDIKNMEPNKCSGLRWINKDNLDNHKIIPYIKYVIQNMGDGLKFLEIEN